MSYCDSCLHREVCGDEGVGEEALIFCKDRLGWIPVSERLPEKNMECLVAVGNFNLTQMAKYSDLMGILNHRIFYQGDYGDENFENITQYVNAWIPLPVRYKSGRKGGNEMTRTLTITYDKSNEDLPVMCVAESNLFSIMVIKIFTGEKAEHLYKELTGQNVIIKAESEDKDGNNI